MRATSGASPRISIRSNAEHLRIKKDIETGNGLPDIALTSEVCDALRMAGFELLEARDLAPDSHPETPWYRALQGRDLSLTSIPRTPIGRALTNVALRVGERLRVFPEGTAAVSTLLNRGADALVEGGESGVFTPMFFLPGPQTPALGRLRVAPHPPCSGLASESEPPAHGLQAVVREAQEVECFRAVLNRDSGHGQGCRESRLPDPFVRVSRQTWR